MRTLRLIPFCLLALTACAPDYEVFTSVAADPGDGAGDGMGTTEFITSCGALYGNVATAVAPHQWMGTVWAQERDCGDDCTFTQVTRPIDYDDPGDLVPEDELEVHEGDIRDYEFVYLNAEVEATFDDVFAVDFEATSLVLLSSEVQFSEALDNDSGLDDAIDAWWDKYGASQEVDDVSPNTLIYVATFVMYYWTAEEWTYLGIEGEFDPEGYLPEEVVEFGGAFYLQSGKIDHAETFYACGQPLN